MNGQAAKQLFPLFLTVFSFFFSMPVFSSASQEILILGYDGKSWFPYIGKIGQSGWEKIENLPDPAYLTWQNKRKRFYIKTNAGQLAKYDIEKQELTPLSQFTKESFTQLRANETNLVMVQLVDGKSRDTHVMSMNDKGEIKKILQQDSAQFHPYQHDKKLYYAHVSCRIECMPLIQEVWEKDLITGKARQVTLLNATTYLHSVDRNGRYGFISSNQQGFYHLAKLDLTTGKIHWLTQGQVTDSFPSISQSGDLFFIRRTSKGSHLMKLSSEVVMDNKAFSEQNLQSIPLPKDVQKIRYLEISDS